MGLASKTFLHNLASPSLGHEPAQVTEPGNRTALWIQTAVGYGLILATVWTPDGLGKIAWMLAAAAAIAAFSIAGRYTWRQMGLRGCSKFQVLRILAYGAVLAAAIPLAAMVTGEHVEPIHAVPWHGAWQYTIWALLQEFILQSFLFVRMESLFPRYAVLITAALFAAAHIPSPVLTLFTFLGGLFFCEMFRRYRSIFPLGIVHAALGLIIAASFSDTVLHHMRVGIGYLEFHL